MIPNNLLIEEEPSLTTPNNPSQTGNQVPDIDLPEGIVPDVRVPDDSTLPDKVPLAVRRLQDFNKRGLCE